MINEKSCVIYHKMLFNFLRTKTYDFYGENLSSKANKTFFSKKCKLIGKIYLYSRLLKYLISSNSEKLRNKNQKILFNKMYSKTPVILFFMKKQYQMF